MKLIESFARPLTVVVCASLAGGCILTTNGEEDTGQDGTGDDDGSSLTNPTSPSDDDDGTTEPDTGADTNDTNNDDDSTTGPSGDCSENLVLDPGFEAGTPSKVWDEASTTFGTPICNTGCTQDQGVAPYEGDFWAWFGGLEEPEAASVAQAITIPAAESAVLTFRFSINATTGTGDDEFTVLVDDTEVFAVTDAEMADYADYTRVEVDVSEFADGAEHTIRFASDHPGHIDTGLITNFFLDNVSLVSCNEEGTDSGDSGGSDGGTTAADESTGGSESDSGSSSDGGSSDSGGSDSSTTTL